VCPPGSPPIDLVTWLPAQWSDRKTLSPEHILGSLVRPCRDGGTLTPDNFAPNEVFVQFLHEFLARELPSRPTLHGAAKRQHQGWLRLVDQRVQDAPRPKQNSEPLPEDLIGAVEVKDGKVVPDSYRRNPAHRLLSTKGLFQLEYALQERLKKEIATRHAFRQAGKSPTERLM
jgi:hypothetical protein